MLSLYNPITREYNQTKKNHPKISKQRGKKNNTIPYCTDIVIDLATKKHTKLVATEKKKHHSTITCKPKNSQLTNANYKTDITTNKTEHIRMQVYSKKNKPNQKSVEKAVKAQQINLRTNYY